MPPWSSDTAALQGRAFIRIMMTMMTVHCVWGEFGCSSLLFSSSCLKRISVGDV